MIADALFSAEEPTGSAGARQLAPGVPGAPLVVLAHGLEDGWSSWRPVAGALGGTPRVVALDLPWRAGNDYTWRGRSAGRWLADALDGVGGRPDVLVAHSFGANAVLDLLSAGDGRIGRSALLVCPFYRRPDELLSWAMLDRSRARFTATIGEGIVARLGRRAGALDPEVLRSMIDLAVRRVGPAAFLSVFEQFVASGALPLGGVGTPTLVLAGGADPVLSVRSAGALAGAIPGAAAVVVPEFDHYCHIRRPQEVAAQVTAFLTTQHPVPPPDPIPTSTGAHR